jgi:hypothetical protein
MKIKDTGRSVEISYLESVAAVTTVQPIHPVGMSLQPM